MCNHGSNRQIDISMFNYKGTCDTDTGWSICNSMFYCLTIITTIGYGHRSPKTTAGKIVTIPYAIGGFALLGIFVPSATQRVKALADELAKSMGMGGKDENKEKTKKVSVTEKEKEIELTWSTENKARPTVSHEASILDEINDEPEMPKNIYQKISTRSRIFYFTLFLILYLLLPAIIFSHIEGWDFFTSLYFVFITLSTIGFGDYTPDFDKIVGYWKFVYQFGVVSWILCSLFGTAYWIGVANLWVSERAKKRIERVRRNSSLAAENIQR